jgi:hypothetical protein
MTRLFFFSWPSKQTWRRTLLETADREYPENWVGEYVEGNGEAFEYGLDFTECGPPSS